MILDYNRHGWTLVGALPYEVALAILPGNPFLLYQRALSEKEQGRITLLHAPMETSES